MYTEATGNAATYEQSNPTESVWDAGASSWDILGNVESSLWDVSLQEYTELSGNAAIWSEA